MDRIAVSSSNLAAVGFDPESSTLEVEFLDGALYQYFDVSESEYSTLMGSESVGKYFSANIRSSYRYAKL